ncbi:peptidase A24A, prepilin type IV [Pyrobaculum islandicum DSM 4184]|uniref:Peptidase A24A, prepilin type IV n=1 Tax=Pyrobaculum islandicum (strain DSM 4184 / JCM 9189 / GEO3) TaxID=384616 RepID=A1RV14_PYRIL|nr:A24 family peptidase [Pyrobaculum islandicum]ABL88796.1 peptidase A24A, prepilin type IV [Pyrobaculum islandicum DSM 4184]
MIGEVALGILLTIAAIQDLKTREIDPRIFIASAAPAAMLIYLNWGSPLYLFSLAIGAALALSMRLLGAGYADSIALALISAAPPVLFLPTPFVVVIAGSLLLPLTMLWLYLKNRKRPCQMSALEKITHVCVSRQEFLKNPLKYIVGEVKDMEKYNPTAIKTEKEWIKARYGLPYLAYLAVGYWAYITIRTLS